MLTLFFILTLLVIGHFVADFCDFMYLGGIYRRILKAKLEYKGLYWLYVHGLVNGICYGLIAALFVTITSPIVLVVICIETILHGGIDHLKSFYYHKNSISYTDKGYWVALGIDQMLHYFTIIGLTYLIYAFA